MVAVVRVVVRGMNSLSVRAFVLIRLVRNILGLSAYVWSLVIVSAGKGWLKMALVGLLPPFGQIWVWIKVSAGHEWLSTDFGCLMAAWLGLWVGEKLIVAFIGLTARRQGWRTPQETED